MNSEIDESELPNLLTTLLAQSKFSDVAALLREVYDAIGETELSSALDAMTEAQRMGFSAESLMTVAWAVNFADSLFNLAVALWNISGRERASIELLRLAILQGSDDAPLAAAEQLLYLGERFESETILRGMIEQRSHGWERAAGLLGREMAETDGRRDEETLGLLQIGSSTSGDFAVVLANVESARGNFARAREILEEQVARRNPMAPIKLGLLFERNLNDTDAAEAAYRQGVELGDAYSAYNLATLLLTRDRRAEALNWLEYAANCGDNFAIERLALEREARGEA